MRGARYFILSALTIFVIVATITSCEKDKTQLPEPVTPEQCPDTISFSGIVEPIIQANCATSGCHNVFTAAAGYNLEGYGNISANANAILNVINHEPGPTPMPYNMPKLNDSIIGQFDCWVVQGKLNN